VLTESCYENQSKNYSTCYDWRWLEGAIGTAVDLGGRLDAKIRRSFRMVSVLGGEGFSYAFDAWKKGGLLENGCKSASWSVISGVSHTLG